MWPKNFWAGDWHTFVPGCRAIALQPTKEGYERAGISPHGAHEAVEHNRSSSSSGTNACPADTSKSTQRESTRFTRQSGSAQDLPHPPKAVLIQCSAGEYRSAPVAACIYAKRAANSPMKFSGINRQNVLKD